MKRGTHVYITIFSIGYLLTLMFTSFSFAGYWTDVAATLILYGYSLWRLFKSVNVINWLKWVLRIANLSVVVFITWLVYVVISNPFSVDKLKLRGFYFQVVDGRLFNAYFKPVGAYSGGYGNFWIAEMPKWFPIIERQVYWERAVHHDFGEDVAEGEVVDNYEVVKEYIRNEVIAK